MKHLVTILIILMSWNISAQIAPQGFNYQGVARDVDNQAFVNQSISIQISLVDYVEGLTAYVERHEVTTSDLGVFSLVIGEGDVMEGDFSNIDWGAGEFYIRTEIDIDGGTDFVLVGESKLFAVPYALYAINGQAGPTGPEGPQGIQGEPGPVGPQGEQGLTGPQGETGPIGPQGVPGPEGPKGDQGTGINVVGSVADVSELPTMGSIGDLYISQDDGHGHVWNGTGFDDIGEIKGPKGDAGPKGDEGEQGPQGPQGEIGSQGPKGDKGDQGEPGIQGIQGPQGLQGEAGIAGEMGIQGEQGEKGETGDPGPQGEPGPIGPQGPAGSYVEGAGIDITGNVIAANDISDSNEIQSLQLSGTTLSLSDGGTVDLAELSNGLALPFYGENDENETAFHIHSDAGPNNYTLAGTSGIEIDEIEISTAGVMGASAHGHGILGVSTHDESAGIMGVADEDMSKGVIGSSVHGVGAHFFTSEIGVAALTTGTGKVGFGTTNPLEKVEIQDSDNTTLSLNGIQSNGQANLTFKGSLESGILQSYGISSNFENAEESSFSIKHQEQAIGIDNENDLYTISGFDTGVGGPHIFNHRWNGFAYMDRILAIEGREDNYTNLQFYPSNHDGIARIMNWESSYNIEDEIHEMSLSNVSYDTTSGIPYYEPIDMYSAKRYPAGNQHDFTGRVSINGNDNEFASGAAFDLEFKHESAKHSIAYETYKNGDNKPIHTIGEFIVNNDAGGAYYNGLYQVISDPTASSSGIGGIHWHHGNMQTNSIMVTDYAFSEDSGNDAKINVLCEEGSFFAGLHIDNNSDLIASALIHNESGNAIETLGNLVVTSNNASSQDPIISINSNSSVGAKMSFNNNINQAHWNINTGMLDGLDGSNASYVDFRFENNSVERTTLSLLGNGNVGVGVIDPVERLEVNGGARINNLIRFGIAGSSNLPNVGHLNGTTTRSLVLNSGGAGISQNIVMLDSGNTSNNGLQPFGSVNLGTSVNRWNTIWSKNPLNSSSDKKLKKNIQPITSSLEKVLQMKPVSYQWKEGNDQSIHIGFIAQEMETIIPEIVQAPKQTKNISGEMEESYYSMSYSELIPVLTQAIQELNEEILLLKEELAKK